VHGEEGGMGGTERVTILRKVGCVQRWDCERAGSKGWDWVQVRLGRGAGACKGDWARAEFGRCQYWRGKRRKFGGLHGGPVLLE